MRIIIGFACCSQVDVLFPTLYLVDTSVKRIAQSPDSPMIYLPNRVSLAAMFMHSLSHESKIKNETGLMKKIE